MPQLKDAPPRVIALPAIDSTSAEARRLFELGDAGPLWVRAGQQLSGRGRSGRRWVSEPGNLYASLLLPVETDAANAASLALAAGVAAHEAVSEMLPSALKAGLTIKWPNDLLLHGKKISGLLLETVTKNSRLAAVILGFGVNCHTSPSGVDRPGASLSDFGVSVAPEALLDVLSGRFAHWHDRWCREGLEPVRCAWLERAGGIGQPILVRLPSGSFEAIFEGVSATGALISRLPDGTTRLISAGDVFLAPGAPGQ